MVNHREGGISQPKIFFPRDIVTYTSACLAIFFIHTAFGLLRSRTIIAFSASAVQGQCRAQAIVVVLAQINCQLLRTLLSVSLGSSWHSFSSQIRLRWIPWLSQL